MRDGIISTQARGWLADARAVTPVFLVHTFVVLAAIGLAQQQFPILSSKIRPDKYGFLVAGLSHWDATFFLLIAEKGYPFARPETSAFFPLYPLAMSGLAHAASFIAHSGRPGPVDTRTYLAAGLVISNICLFAALIVLLRIGREMGSTRRALRGLWLFALFPSAFYLSAAYSESMFLLWASLSLWLGHRRRWVAAGMCAALALLTRNVGIFLVPALLWMVWRWHQYAGAPWRRVIAAAIAVCVLPAIGLSLYMLYMWQHLHRPLAFLWAESHYWHRHYAWPWTSLHLAYAHDPMGFLAALFFLVLLLYSLGQLSVDQWLFSAGQVLIPICSVAGSYPMSLIRLCLMAFPLFLLLGSRIRRVETFAAAVAVSALLMAWLAGTFATDRWVA